jgi:hypothetical protein
MTNPDISQNNYDPHITPAETAARIEREGEAFKKLPESEESLDTTGGYTVDKEGLINNFAVEPEMYYEVPGDLKAKEEQAEQERAQEMSEVNQTDKSGQLTMEEDKRGKGTGII